jgi:3',5'-cyclic-AMP phosphodiesterase
MKIPVYLSALAVIFLFTACSTAPEPDEKSDHFKFAFITDIHVQPEKGASEGFARVIDTLLLLGPDFVLTGGDLIMDALATSEARADSQFQIYKSHVEKLPMPVYHVLGNHDIYGWDPRAGVDSTHSRYGKAMFKEHLGPTYYGFEHKGWQFYVLDVLEKADGRYYKGWINQEQIDWLRNELKNVSSATPVAIVVHIPLVTVLLQVNEGSMVPNSRGLVVENSKELLDLFVGHKLKLVLQGHLHYLEDIYANGTRFITSPAVSGNWWKGPRMGIEEGFLLFDIHGEEIKWEFIDYGWEAI